MSFTDNEYELWEPDEQDEDARHMIDRPEDVADFDPEPNDFDSVYDEEPGYVSPLKVTDLNPDKRNVLKTAIETVPDGLGSLYLFHAGQYCALGWLLHCAGVSDDLLDQMDDELALCEDIYAPVAEWLGLDYQEYVEQIHLNNDRADNFRRKDQAITNFRRIQIALGCE